jgi:hypothetical protein
LSEVLTMNCHTGGYRVFAALHEDTDKGWVWLLLKECEGFRSRMTIKISRGQHSVYCQHRNFDENFVRKYDSSDETTSMYFGIEEKDHARQKDLARDAVRHRVKVVLPEDVIVISGWYRRALGDLKRGSREQLTITKPWFSPWADLRAACQHPEPGMRIATRIAILGTWLGVTAFLAALAEVAPLKGWLEHNISYPALWALVLAGLFGIACLFAGRGVKR